jgi:tRNA U34 5-methylaminomethyl-2-thiouridine-forming methyltransferase MnmC
VRAAPADAPTVSGMERNRFGRCGFQIRRARPRRRWCASGTPITIRDSFSERVFKQIR